MSGGRGDVRSPYDRLVVGVEVLPDPSPRRLSKTSACQGCLTRRSERIRELPSEQIPFRRATTFRRVVVSSRERNSRPQDGAKRARVPPPAVEDRPTGPWSTCRPVRHSQHYRTHEFHNGEALWPPSFMFARSGATAKNAGLAGGRYEYPSDDQTVPPERQSVYGESFMGDGPVIASARSVATACLSSQRRDSSRDQLPPGRAARL